MRHAYRVIAPLALLLLLIPAAAHAQANESGSTGARQPKLTKLPKLVHFEQAVYPESEKAAQRTASVILQIAIDDKGRVEDAAIAQSAGAAFDAAAQDAVRKFQFEPAEVDNKPAPVKITYRYEFVFVEEPKSPIINFDGDVKNRFTKKPLAGITIKLEGIGETVTDEQGHFEFKEVPDGEHVIAISGPELTPVTTSETLEKGKKLSVKYSLEPKEEVPVGEESDLEIVVVAPKIQKEVVSTEIKAEEGRRVPGTQGDTLKVVQNLPGVARASFGSGQLVVWGAAPQDTRVYVDGVHVPILYHGGGLRSTFSSELVRAINLAPGGYGSEYGRGLGGLVTIDTRSLRADRVHGFVAADIIDSAALMEAPITNRTRIAVAARKSYLKNTLSAFTSEDVSDFVPIPDYYDAQLKVTHDLGKNESVELLGLISRDTLTRTLTNTDPAQIKREDSLTSFNRVSVRYNRQLDDGSVISVSPWAGRDHLRTRSSFGGTPSELDTSSDVFGFRAAWRGRTAQHVVTTVGLDVEGSSSSLSRQGSVTLPPREGDITVFGQAPPEQVNADTWSSTLASVAPYAQMEISLFQDKLRVTPGLRIEPFITTASRQTPVIGDTPSIGITTETTAVDPRLALAYQAAARLSLKAAFGVYHQSPQASDLSAVFGNPTVGVERATHWLAGGTFKLTEKLSVEAVAFYSKSSELVTRSPSSTPSLARLLLQDGEGRAYGTQLLLRQELARGFFGWVSYTLMRSERKDHPDQDWRLFDYDQTHVATIVASYELGKGFEFGVRLRYASGFPRTPVVDAYRSLRRDVYEPVFGPQNSTRIPEFVQGDMRFSKRFELGFGKAEFYLDVQNATNRKNAEEVVYDYRYRERKYITGLPVLPVIGGRFEW